MENSDNKWSDDEVKRFWAWSAEHYPHKYFTCQIGDKLVDMFRQYIKDDISILDYGAGLGFFSEQVLKKTSASITSCDFSPESVQKQQERCSKYPNFGGAFTVDELIQQHKKFDVIFCFEVLEHCNDSYLKQTYDNFAQLLAPDGIVIASTPNNENLEDDYIICPSCGKVFHRVQHERNWTQHSLTIYTKDAGFDVINLYSTDFATSVKKSAIKTLKSKFRNFLTKLGLKRRKKQPPREGYTLIIIFKKNNLSLS